MHVIPSGHTVMVSSTIKANAKVSTTPKVERLYLDDGVWCHSAKRTLWQSEPFGAESSHKTQSKKKLKDSFRFTMIFSLVSLITLFAAFSPILAGM